jgi:hypothetical protein
MRGIDDRMQERQDRINRRGQERRGQVRVNGRGQEMTGEDRINGRRQGKDRKGQD